eukprot:1460326-Pleurochrysis_carterae.AAC.1
MDVDNEDSTWMESSFDLESAPSSYVASAGCVSGGDAGSRVSDAAECALRAREAELKRKIDRADQIEQDLLATKARMESYEQQLAQRAAAAASLPEDVLGRGGEAPAQSQRVRFASDGASCGICRDHDRALDRSE